MAIVAAVYGLCLYYILLRHRDLVVHAVSKTSTLVVSIACGAPWLIKGILMTALKMFETGYEMARDALTVGVQLVLNPSFLIVLFQLTFQDTNSFRDLMHQVWLVVKPSWVLGMKSETEEPGLYDNEMATDKGTIVNFPYEDARVNLPIPSDLKRKCTLVRVVRTGPTLEESGIYVDHDLIEEVYTAQEEIEKKAEEDTKVRFGYAIPSPTGDGASKPNPNIRTRTIEESRSKGRYPSRIPLLVNRKVSPKIPAGSTILTQTDSPPPSEIPSTRCTASTGSVSSPVAVSANTPRHISPPAAAGNLTVNKLKKIPSALKTPGKTSSPPKKVVIRTEKDIYHYY